MLRLSFAVVLIKNLGWLWSTLPLRGTTIVQTIIYIMLIVSLCLCTVLCEQIENIQVVIICTANKTNTHTVKGFRFYALQISVFFFLFSLSSWLCSFRIGLVVYIIRIFCHRSRLCTSVHIAAPTDSSHQSEHSCVRNPNRHRENKIKTSIVCNLMRIGMEFQFLRYSLILIEIFLFSFAVVRECERRGFIAMTTVPI